MMRMFRVGWLAGMVAITATAALAGPVPAATTAVGVDPAAVSLQLAAGETATIATTVTTPLVAPRPDIVFLADTTGSMDPALANVSNNLRAIVDEVRRSQPDARFAVASYKEQRDGPRAFMVDTPFTGDVNEVQNGVNQWLYNVGGGGQPWTDFLNAHYRIATDAVAFRPAGTRIVAWFGDARSHDPSLGRTLADTSSAVRSQDVRVVAVPISGTTGGGLDALGQATALTAATNGVLLPERPADQVAQGLLAGLTSLPVTVTPKATCDPAVTVGFDRASHPVRSGTAASFGTTVAARPDAPAGTHHCTVDYLVGGVSNGSVQDITVTVGPETTPPTITAKVAPAAPDGANGWYVSPPTVSFTCADASGISSCTGPVALGSSAQPQRVTGTAVDTRGNRASLTTPGLKVDQVDPTLACGPRPTFTADSPGQLTASVTDAHSGPATPTVSAAADTTTVGNRTVRLTGTDLAGRRGTVDCPYAVQRVPAALLAHPARLTTRPVLQFVLTPRATLTRSDTGAPLAGRPVAFAVGNRQVCSAATSSTGVATCTGPVDLVSYLLTGYTATYAGSDTTTPATARGR